MEKVVEPLRRNSPVVSVSNASITVSRVVGGESNRTIGAVESRTRCSTDQNFCWRQVSPYRPGLLSHTGLYQQSVPQCWSRTNIFSSKGRRSTVELTANDHSGRVRASNITFIFLPDRSMITLPSSLSAATITKSSSFGAFFGLYWTV